MSIGGRGDPGEIQGRSIDLWEYGVQEYQRRREGGKEVEVGGMRARRVLGEQ